MSRVYIFSNDRIPTASHYQSYNSLKFRASHHLTSSTTQTPRQCNYLLTQPQEPTYPNDAMTSPKLKTTIAILGCGDVGSTLAYTLILQPICSEVILVDPKTTLLEAQVRDLNDATYRGGTSVRVRAGTHADAGRADIVVITAGAKQKPGESRLSLLSRNLHILESIFSAMAPISPHTILLLVANPVDILTYFARRLSGLPESQVLGTGTSLDSARLRGVLSERAGVAPSSIDAYVLGEHGDSQFVSKFSLT